MRLMHWYVGVTSCTKQISFSHIHGDHLLKWWTQTLHYYWKQCSVNQVSRLMGLRICECYLDPVNAILASVVVVCSLPLRILRREALTCVFLLNVSLPSAQSSFLWADHLHLEVISGAPIWPLYLTSSPNESTLSIWTRSLLIWQHSLFHL